MIVIPAVDIRNGKCVRLSQGRADQEIVYDDNPLEIAVEWVKKGAPMIHVVDLDGAFEGTPQNSSLIESILLNVHVPVQVGGGIRSPATVERYLSAGAARVILGTMAYHNFGMINDLAKMYPEKIVLGIDAKNGKVAIDGWVHNTKTTAGELAAEYSQVPIAGFVYTDVSRDGMLTGPNLESIAEFCRATAKNVIASGGISSLDDITNLVNLKQSNIEGVIIGKALYAGAFTLDQALQAVAD